MVKSIESSRIEEKSSRIEEKSWRIKEKHMQYQHIKRRQMLGAVPCLMLAGLPAIAPAQASFPSRPLRVIVPQPPGGGFDFVAQRLGNDLQNKLVNLWLSKTAQVQARSLAPMQLRKLIRMATRF